jgi:multidrug efflux pump
MVISSSWPGATAKEMELQVTDKIEKVIQTVPGRRLCNQLFPPRRLRVITVDHEGSGIPGVEVKKRWQEVRNLVNDAKKDLPSDLYGPYYNDHFDDVYGNIYAITSDSYLLRGNA